MAKPLYLPAIVPVSSCALTTSTGSQCIAIRMAEDLLNVARSRERALAVQRRYRISEYEFREADHEQIQRWARMLGTRPESVVEGLGKMQTEPGYPFMTSESVGFHVQDGSIFSLSWDFAIFPLTDWAWIDGLKIERMGILNHKNGRLPTLPSCLRRLFFRLCELSDLDLTPVPGLIELDCSENQLRDLDLTPVPRLTRLGCEDNQLSDLDLTPVPLLIKLNCCYNQLSELDLASVPMLVEIDCSYNQLNDLDWNSVPRLRRICYEGQSTSSINPAI